MGTAESKEGENRLLFREPSDVMTSPEQGSHLLPPPILPSNARITTSGSLPFAMQSPDELAGSQPQIVQPSGNPPSVQSHAHIPVNLVPGPTHHKIAQPARQSDPALGQQSTFLKTKQFSQQVPPTAPLDLLASQAVMPEPKPQVAQPGDQAQVQHDISELYQDSFSESITEKEQSSESKKLRSVAAVPSSPVKESMATLGDAPSSPEPSSDSKVIGTPDAHLCTPQKDKPVMPTPPSDSAPSETSEAVSPEIKLKIKKTVNEGKQSLTSTLLSSDNSPPRPQVEEPPPIKKRHMISHVTSGLPFESASPAKPSTVAQRRDTAKAAKIAHLPKGPQMKQVVPPTDEKPCEWLVGDLVWSKVSGHPWWPCMVAYDPNLGIYTRMKGSGFKTYRTYHVQFFGEVPERGWVSGSSMKKFTGRDQYDTLVQDMVNKVRKAERSRMLSKLAVKPCRRAAWDAAINECESALPMSRHERKLNFTFKYENPKAKPSAEQVDIVSLGDSPKMKAKRAYKKHRESLPSGGAANMPADKKPAKERKKGTPAEETPKKKRGRKTTQFMEFSKLYKEEIIRENPGIGQREIYTKLEEKWEGLSEEEREKYGPKVQTPPQKKERKRKVSPEPDPENAPVLKRSKREPKPSKKLQEADLSSIGYSPKHVASIKKHSEASQSESQDSEPVATPKTSKPRTPVPPAQPIFEKASNGKKARSKKSDAAPLTPAAENPPKKRRYRKAEKQANGDGVGIVARPDAITSDMSQDFAEMQDDDEEGGLVIDTNLLAGALQTVTGSHKDRHNSATNSETDASSQHGSTTMESTSSGSQTSRDRSGAGGGAAKKENVCQVCESPGQLLLCEGGCCGAFHLDCIGLQMEPTGSFKCDECISGVHSCYVCKVSDQEVKRCHVSVCGKYYHEECIRKFPLTRFDHRGFTCPLHSCLACFADNPKNTKASRGRLMRCVRCPTAYHTGEACVAAGSIVLAANSIVCSRHFQPIKSHKHHSHVSVSWCFTCSLGGDILICCESCPASYHPKCQGLDAIPEGNWFCRDCINGKKPRYGDIVWVKLGNYRWWPGLVCNPKDVPQNIQDKTHQVGEFPVQFFGSNDYFWTHQGRVFEYQEGDKGSRETTNSKGLAAVFKAALKEASERYKVWKASKEQKIAKELENSSKKPAPFKFIKANRPVGNVVMPTFDITQCQACECTPQMDNPCGPDSDCLNRILLIECHPQVCPAKEKCQNQRFQKRLYPEAVPMKVNGRGWGLIALIDIKKGDFVNEYVGELVDEEECRRRIKQAHDENIVDFYFLTIEKDRIIDAGPKGNLSRFMNHSCQPNCETQKWTVNGDTRVGLFAIRNIPAGSEISFNYNLDCLGNEKKRCECGAPNCSGFIGVRPKTAAAAASEERSKQAKDKKKKRVRKKPALLKVKHEDECFRCGEGGELVMCDVRVCPKSYHLACLGLEKHPYGKWQCPWHHCDVCGKASTTLCEECPNSYCKVHCTNATVIINGKHFCREHDPDEMQKMEEDRIKLAELKAEADALAKQCEQRKLEKKQRRKSKLEGADGDGGGSESKQRRRKKAESGSEGSDSKTDKVKLVEGMDKIEESRKDEGASGDHGKVNGIEAEVKQEESEDQTNDDALSLFDNDSDAELVIDETFGEKEKKKKKKDVEMEEKVPIKDSTPSSSPKKKKKDKKHKKDKDKDKTKDKDKKDKKEKAKVKELKMKEREKLLQKMSHSKQSTMVNGSSENA